MRLKPKKAAAEKTDNNPLNVEPDHAQLFDTLDKDVLGDDGSDSENDFKSNAKGKYGRRGGDDDSDNEEDKEPSYMFFDFRKGISEWPSNAELVDQKTAESLLEKATIAAEEMAKLKKKDTEAGGDDADGKQKKDNKDSSLTKSSSSSSSSYSFDINDNDTGPQIHPETTFETLKDGSTALIIKPGFRLKLKLNELLEGGDEKKEAREKKKLQREKKKMKGKSSSSSSSNVMIGPSMFDDDDDDWLLMSKMKNKWFKEYINKYTITMDIKVMEELPRDGCSLFQTALIHVKEDKRSGKTTMTRSDGEAVINQAGGIGIFGTFGDTTKAKLDVGQWKRVVVTVSCAEGSTAGEKGEIRTWINTEAGAIVKEDTIVANERFAIDPDNLFLFSSAQPNMMPGNIAVRTIRVQQCFSTDKDVKANRAKDKVLSMFNETVKKQVIEQRKGLALAPLFPKPRPMWLTPSFVGVFGDAFIESTTLEGTSNLAWTYTVFNFVLQRLAKHPLIVDDKIGLNYNERVVLSDTLHIMSQSTDVFKNMLKVLKNPSDSQLLSFLRKLKKSLQGVGVGESLLIPVLIEERELILLLERSGDRHFKVVIVQTDPQGGLRHHAATPAVAMPEIRYRTCMILRDVPKKNILDDVFWMALFNMSIHNHKDDIHKFYDILVPFLTGKPLEASLVESETAALNDTAESRTMNFEMYGDWRAPQRSDTAYVRCILESLYYILRCKGVSEASANQIHLAVRCEMVSMMENDLHFVLPHVSDVRVCELAVRELSHFAVKFVDSLRQQQQSSSSSSSSSSLSLVNSGISVSVSKDVNTILDTVLNLISTVNQKLVYSKAQDTDLPPTLELTATAVSTSDHADINIDPSLSQYQNMLAWNVSQCIPDPGQAVALRKYIPIDFFQLPQRASSRREAVQAIRMCDKLCTLIDNQTHCIKNDKFLIISLIEHVFTQVLPIPKPQGVSLSDSDLYISGRSSRRSESKQEKERVKAEEKKKKKEAAIAAAAAKDDSKTKNRNKLSLSASSEAKYTKSVQEKEIKYFGGVKLDPDFAPGKDEEEKVLKQKCIWQDERLPLTYELQVELLLTIQRLVEHFAAAAFSIHQNRAFDGVCIIVTGCMTAISDVIMRQRAVDEPSEACCLISGRTVDDRQLGFAGFGINVGTFATQCETIEIHTPELCIAKTAVLDYFQSPRQRKLEKIFNWDEDFIHKPGKSLIRYLRMISREIGLPILRPHLQLVDAKPMSSLVMKNYPEVKCYRDIVFFWKYFLNPDRKVFPNYSTQDEPKEIGRQSRMTAQLNWDWDEEKNGYDITAFGVILSCRPDPKQVNPLTGKLIAAENLPIHRFPSTATPSFYVPAPAVRTEDDVIYRANLPSFEDKYGQVLNQRDSELLISYLTVPYMRLPLILSFFASEDRIHKLQSNEIRLILDSVMFEPGKYLRMDCTSVEPVMVPTIHTDLLATPYGLLMNELCRSPDVIIRSILLILKGAFACDTGTVADTDATDFNTSTTIIIYVTRLGARFDNYISFIIDWSMNKHDCVEGSRPLRDMDVSEECLKKLVEGREQVREILREQFDPLFEDYLKRLDAETSKDPTNETLINRNSALACELHSHKLIIYRNYSEADITPSVAITLLGSFVYLTTRHTWNKMTKQSNPLKIPETELYELLQVQRRRLVSWMNSCRQGTLDVVMQTSLQISSSLTGSLKASAAYLEAHNRWSRITGDRSCGRWAVGSTRTTSATATSDTHSTAVESSRKNSNSMLLLNVPRSRIGSTDDLLSNDNDNDSIPGPIKLQRQQSYDKQVGEVEDTGLLGIEMDVQVGQMTLRSKHLSALIPDIANHPDVNMVFGDATIQASLIESAEHRFRYRLVGLNHEIDYWPTVHYVCPPLADEYEREYDPSELFDSEKWITSIFEPVRKAFFDGPSPPPMQFMMPEKQLSSDAEVAVLVGLHQNLGGPFKLVYLFKKLKCLHVYECLSHGREWWYSLHLTTDYRYCLRELQPSYKPRTYQFPDWWLRGAGQAYPMGVGENLVNDIDGVAAKPGASVLIIREKQHPLNLSGGKELLIPSRLLYGLVSDALLVAYSFYQDESVCPSDTLPDNFINASRGYKRLRGYPKEGSDSGLIIFVEIQDTLWKWNDFNANVSNSETNNENIVQITKFPGRTVKIFSRPKEIASEMFRVHKRIASAIEACGILTEPQLLKKKNSEDEAAGSDTSATAGKDEMIFKIDAAVECDYEGKGEFWPCLVRRVNDNNTYDLEYVNDYKWVGIQRGVDPTLVQNRGDGDRKKKGEGSWHFDGMTESEDDDFKAKDDRNIKDKDDNTDDEEEGEGNKSIKHSLNYYYFDQLQLIYEAAGYDEDLCVSYIQRLGSVPGVSPFTDIRKFAAAVGELANTRIRNSGSSSSSKTKLVKDFTSEDMVLLNMLYAPQRSRLHSLMKTLVRVETAAYILGWTKASNCHNSSAPGALTYGCPPLDSVELPRLKLTFTAREDHEGVLRLYSVDHVDLYVTDEYNDMTVKMLESMPHSLLMTNVRGETQVLVPVITPHRPPIVVEPFTTFLVFDRKELLSRSERFFLYPVHVSLSFLLTKGLNSAIYLMLLRFLHRDYEDVFRLADSTATDTKLNEEGLSIFKAFSRTNSDRHPDAHACRMKISLVTIDSGTESPWDLTTECARYIVKLDSVSCSCRLPPLEELQLLESDAVVTSSSCAKYNVQIHDEYIMCLCYNRQQQLRSLLKKTASTNDIITNSTANTITIGHDSGSDGLQVSCRIPARAMSTNWPYYQDNTVFGENYMSMKEIITAGENTNATAVTAMDSVIETSVESRAGEVFVEHSWRSEMKGGTVEDDIDAPPGGWLVVACFHTLWSAGCIKIMPAVTELVPLYQDMSTFLSIRADCQGVMQVSKSLKITVFPTFLILRGGVELERLEGHDRVIERLVRSLSHNLKDSDKICNAKRRHRIRLERALELGLPPPAEEVEEKGQLSWTWDNEQCGESMQIKGNGMLCILTDDDDEEEDKVQWEYCVNGRKWLQFNNRTNKEIESEYRSGNIYGNGYSYLSELEIYPNDINIGSYEIKGFNGSLIPSYQRVDIRRKGDRLPVPNEEQYLSKEQKERDVKQMEWKEKYKIYKREMKEKRRGNDIQAIRGTIGMLPNTGIHTWQLHWNHEPASSRGGVGDSFGMCSDGCENWGPGSNPLLGSALDQGCSIALDASGDIYHKGKIIHTLKGIRRNPEYAMTTTTTTTTVPKTDNDNAASDTTILTSTTDSDTTKLDQTTTATSSTTTSNVDSSSVVDTSNATSSSTAAVVSSSISTNSLIAPLFGKSCVVKCILDTGLDGGTLTLKVERIVVGNVVVTPSADEAVSEYTVNQVFTLLGGSELFPCISLAPLDPVVEVSAASTEATGTSESTENSANVVDSSVSEEEGKVVSELQLLVNKFPSVALLPHEDEAFSSEMQTIMTRNDATAKPTEAELTATVVTTDDKPVTVTVSDTVVKSTDAIAADTGVDNKLAITNTTTDSTQSVVEATTTTTPTATDTTTAEQPAADSTPAATATNNNTSSTTAIDVPIEKVRWMYEGDGVGWNLYSVEASRLLEENLRDGKQTFLLTIGETTHTCNLESKKLTLDTGDKEFRIRRHVISDGLQGQWEMLSMKYEKPSGLQGQGLLKILEKVWNSHETCSGQQAGLGFLFLYSLLSGDVRAKVVGGTGDYGGSWMMGGSGGGMMGGGSASSFFFGGRRAMGSSSTDSHRFGLLLTQLLKDKHTKSLTASVLNVLGRNRQVSLRMPKFKDSRKVTNTPFFNGWVDETEPRSPIAELFSKVVPVMVNMKRKGAFHFPPPPPHDEMAAPPNVVTLKASSVDNERPELTDYGCEQRSITSVSSALVAQLINRVNYRISGGNKSLKPQIPTAVEDAEHLNKLYKRHPDRLLILLFGASWCSYCKSLAPVYRKLSLEHPTALFLKLDVDECESLSARFTVESLPTTIFVRHGITPQYVVATIKGGGSSYIEVFKSTFLQLSSPEELTQLELFRKNVPEGNLQEFLDNLGTTPSQVNILAQQPMSDCNLFVHSYSRQELNLQNVDPVLAFDVSNHEAANTAPAQSVLTRFKEDVEAYATQANTMPIVKFGKLADHVILDYFNPTSTANRSDVAEIKLTRQKATDDKESISSNSSSVISHNISSNDRQTDSLAQTEAEALMNDGLERAKMLMRKLRYLQECDTSCVKELVPLLEVVANWVSLESPSSANSSLNASKTRYLLNRYSGQNANIWIEYLFGVLLSTQGEADLLKLNPYLPAETISTLLNMISLIMLRSNRLGQTNRCIGTLINLISLLEKVIKIPRKDRIEKGATLAPKLIQLSEDLSKMISMERYYMTKQSTEHKKGLYTFDPRYLVFEFVWNIQLRQKQVEIVNDFRSSLDNNVSKVKQMIMGAGKTSVVAPLLALILANGKSLVLSVVPKALVEMSRTRMRETFASIMVKRIYTLEFDRSTSVKAAMRRGLENATSNRGIVIATPTTLKSVMLSYVETLQHLREAHANGARSKVIELSNQAEEFQKILKIFQDATMLLDEVDLILHPLKSELNFPVGEKFDLDGSEEGERWSLPIHLLDALLFIQTNRITSFEQRGMALEILKRLAATVQQGINERHLQRLPHVTLLNPDFYRSHIMPVMAEWAFLWLQKAHLHGIDRHEAIQYILEGAASKSDIMKKIHLIDTALTKALITLGELPPEPEITKAHKSLLTPAELELKNLALLDLKRQNSETITSDAYTYSLMKAYIDQLELIKSEASLHNQLVHEIYAIDDEIEKSLKDAGHQQAELQTQIMSLNSQIAEIECPRDDSLDNCIVVWCSQAFAMSNTMSGSGSTALPGETSVLTICNHLEDAGLTIRRCSDADEAISRARDLQLENQLRCVIIGGDELGMSCGPSCVKSHHGEKCVKCGGGFSTHNSHECPVGGRGSFPLEKPANLKTINALQVMKTLTDDETPYARAHSALPTLRTAIYCAHVPVKEDDRMAFWKLGTTVTDDPKELLSYVTGLPSWKDAPNHDDEVLVAEGIEEHRIPVTASAAESKSMSIVNSHADDHETTDITSVTHKMVPASSLTVNTSGEGEGKIKSPLHSKQVTDLFTPRTSDRIKLAKLKEELEKIEIQKNHILEISESDRKQKQQTATSKHMQLEDAVENSIKEIAQAENELRLIIAQLGYTVFAEEESKNQYIGAHTGKDAAMAKAYLNVNRKRLERVIEKKTSSSSYTAVYGLTDSIDSSDNNDEISYMKMPNEANETSFMKTLTKHWSSLNNELQFLKKMSLASKVVSHVSSPLHKKLLNLCHGWLSVFLPHCLAKVNRVSFGLLTAEDCQAALKNDPHVPRSRLKLAVPFIGKDVPSKASEFAHPDIIIGLTILAYRYSGLRKDDFTDIVDNLTSQFTHEIGPARDRESSQKHESWVHAAGGSIRGLKSTRDGKIWMSSTSNNLKSSKENHNVMSNNTNTSGDDDEDGVNKEVVQLKFLQKSNDEQMEKLYKLLQKEPLVIHDYLQKTVFATYMRSQRMKISASGQAVGGDMLVSKRVGFSGTPSDLLPQELGRCDYETGDDGMMLTTVLDRAIASYSKLPDQWNVEQVLDMIANSESPRFNALIDTGALITGYSNREVAEELLKRGLEWCEGVVFLDDDDKQQVLVRATQRVVSADQCGVSLEKRFAFYDQIHTTGMDIKHVVNATAAITLGKDMVFRDYVQGAYRMRGIGIGQKIHVLIIPEVDELIQRELKDCVIRNNSINNDNNEGGDHVLEDIVAWLIINSLRSEQTQWTMLCIQNIGNLYRKNAMKCLLENTQYFIKNEKVESLKASTTEDTVNTSSSTVAVVESNAVSHPTPTSPAAAIITSINDLDKDAALKLFDEEIDFSLEASVPDPVPFEKKLRSMLDTHASFLLPHQHEIGHSIMVVVGQFAMVEGYAKRLDSEQEREQEQEQEKEVEQRRDQQVEVEKFVDREYSRQEETQRPWPFSILAKPLDPTSSGVDSEHPFYPLRDFKLRHQEPLEFPESLLVSSNYFNPTWTGLRRVKNVVMIMEYAPSVSPEFLHLKSFDERNAIKLTSEQETALIKAHQLMGFHAAANGNPNTLSREDLRNAIAAVLDMELVNESFLQNIIDKFSRTKHDHMSLDEFRSLLTCGLLFPQSSGRYWVALSLAEAETIRRILHIRTRKQLFNNQIIPDRDTELALRYSLIAGSSASQAGDGGLVFDVTPGWKQTTRASTYEAAVAHSCFRYFDCDMHFPIPALNILIRVLHGSNRDRERFFTATVGCRRRMERKWQETPLARVFLINDEWIALKQKAQTIFFVEALKAKNLTLWEGFTKFDADNNGILSPAEFYGALKWLGVPELTAEDVVDFIEAADKNRDGFIDYKEYAETYSNKDKEEDDDGDEGEEKGAIHRTNAGVENTDGDITDVIMTPSSDAIISKIVPFGADDLREIMVQRKQLEQSRQREERLRSKAYKEALDVKVYEEELQEATRSRVGGANPSVIIASLTEPVKPVHGDDVKDMTDDQKVSVTDFKFDRNQVPIRFVPTGKYNFIPIDIGTAADHPVKPMTCKKKHAFSSYNYYWMNCDICRKQNTDWTCWNCWYHVCSACYDGDKHFQEHAKRDCTKHPTFLRCLNVCSFTLQIPTHGGADPVTGDYTLSVDLRVSRLPPSGHLQSLFRFPLSDLELARRSHRTSIYLNAEGSVVARPLVVMSLLAVTKPSSANLKDSTKVTVTVTIADDNKDTTAAAAVTSTTTNDIKSETNRVGRVKPGYWSVVTLVVSPLSGTVTSYVNGNLCHKSTNLDPADFKLHHKLVVLGGGKQAHARGGDVRRMIIHNKALDEKAVVAVFASMASTNPGVGKRVAKFQALYKGYIYRKHNKIEKKDLNKKDKDDNEEEEEEDDEEENSDEEKEEKE